ncbi:hypothetical protein [Streptomyces spongiicola]|uniref:hypothetical protein n=1 Tax=Streptomyces spongiicola TaxID=1690221 RepID=UPI000E2FB1B9|nr:hypothetical protein [Streptomyces spongiicola]
MVALVVLVVLVVLAAMAGGDTASWPPIPERASARPIRGHPDRPVGGGVPDICRMVGPGGRGRR